MKNGILILFITLLVLSACKGIFPVYAILITMLLYFIYGVAKGLSARDLLSKMLASMKTSAGVFLVFTFIGVMGALWRSSGLMALLVIHGLSFLHPGLFLLFSFGLCSIFSFLIGSSFATVSILGVLLVTIGQLMGIPLAMIGGSVLSGAFVGDRASFLSSSAYLTATITGVDYKVHVRNLLREAPVALLLTGLIYTALSLSLPALSNGTTDLSALKQNFNLDYWLILLPLLMVLLPIVTPLTLLHGVILSSLTAFVFALIYQEQSLSTLLSHAFYGYYPTEKALHLLNGGGLLSMLKPMIMVAVSSALPPLLSELDVLGSLNRIFQKISLRTCPFVASVTSGLFTTLIGCSQTLAMLLQLPILNSIYRSDQQEAKALSIGNTAVIYSCLVPWNIAMANALIMMNAPVRSGLFAFYPVIQTLVILVIGRRRYE